MKYIKTQKTYKASNVFVTIGHEKRHYVAYSYNWWQFLMVYNDKVIFNNHAYSTSTRAQQSKVLDVLRREGVKIDHFVDSRASLTCDWRADALTRLTQRIDELTDLINKKGTRKAKNAERLQMIEHLKFKMTEIVGI